MAKTPEELRPFGGWDWAWRGLFQHDHQGSTYVVDIDYFDFDEKIVVYKEGRLWKTEKSPAVIPIDQDTTIEAALSLYGMKHVRLGTESFEPCAGTGEAWRRDLKRTHPQLSRALAVLAWLIVVFAFVTQIPVYLNILAGFWGGEFPTFDFPVWFNGTMTVLGILAGLDRALRLTHNSLLDD